MGNREQRSNKEQKKKAVMTPKEKKIAKRSRKEEANTAKSHRE